MNAGRFLPCALAASIGFLASCSGAGARIALEEANFLSLHGSQQEAVAAYSRAAADAEVAPYAAYGLGVSYLAVGELGPAANRFEAAAAAAASGADAGRNEGAERELAYRAHYNLGIVRFRSGDFTGAVADFRQALEADGSRKTAKRNLELSIRMQSRKSAPAASSAQLGTRQAGPEPKTLFDYVREKDSERWRSREWRAESTDTLDY